MDLAPVGGAFSDRLVALRTYAISASVGASGNFIEVFECSFLRNREYAGSAHALWHPAFGRLSRGRPYIPKIGNHLVPQVTNCFNDSSIRKKRAFNKLLVGLEALRSLHNQGENYEDPSRRP